MRRENGIDFIGLGSAHSGVQIVLELLATHPAVADKMATTGLFADANFTPAALEAFLATIEHSKTSSKVGIIAQPALTSVLAPERIAHVAPDAKLIVVVRNPLERMVLAYRTARTRGMVPRGMTCGAYAAKQSLVQTDGLYGKWLANFAPYYSPQQLKVVVYEDLHENPLKVVQELFAFLEIDPQFVPARLVHYAPPPDEPLHRGRISRLVRWIISLMKRPFEKEPQPAVPPALDLTQELIPEEIALFSQVYRADAKHVSYILNRNMAVAWGLEAANDE